ncbi:N-acetyltransferase [Umezawaea sp. Da 62-37]|uniref:GNAT family N-acetyltransferase n=1 Tax=Umezawaea sp. Da 62-37 TaxID=3075927 RepID=UPI0028F72AAD|nr:N-acetyltransferase [Umezawaea sp. Da 62-37]WNV83075.1 N-acetyltransferase [Umezawaea sp. Da 62-37]
MTTIGIDTLVDPGDATARVAGGIISGAFSTLPPTRWLTPRDAPGRVLILNEYFTLQIEEILAGGSGYVDLVQGGLAVAVWNRVDPEAAHGASEQYSRRLEAVCGPWTPRFRAFEEGLAFHHPVRPHEHLVFLGVHRDHQRRGLGRALLRHRLADLDRRDQAAFLETTTPANIELYTKVGFVVVDRDPVHGDLAPWTAPDDLTTVSPMWRDPQPNKP